MRGGAGQGRVGFEKSKPILAPPHSVGLKSHPIPTPLPLQSGENPYGMKRGRARLPSIFLSEMIYMGLSRENFYF